MKRILVVSLLLAALGAPAALAADPAPADFKNAAKYCKAVREAKGVEAIATQYGTNKNKKNAYGKCVSATAKAKAKAGKKDEKGQDAEEQSAATATCKKEQSANAAKFGQDYKNFGQCVKAHNGGNDDDDD